MIIKFYYLDNIHFRSIYIYINIRIPANINIIIPIRNSIGNKMRRISSKINSKDTINLGADFESSNIKNNINMKINFKLFDNIFFYNKNIKSILYPQPISIKRYEINIDN